MAEDRTLVLVHGAWCGDWIFSELKPCLERRGIRYVGTNLPTCGATDASVSAHDDADYLRDLMDRIDGPVVLVGKSYGGAIISGAGVDRPGVAHLVYIAAVMPEPREPFHRSMRAALTPEFARGVGRLPDGRLTMDLEVGARCAFSQASEHSRDRWRREARPMSMGPDPAVAFDRVAWNSVPSTYIVCGQDEAIDPMAQRAWATRASHTIEAPFDHTPGVSQPDAVAEILGSIART